MVCSIVQLHSVPPPYIHTPSQAKTNTMPTQKFVREGCPNCEHVLSLRGNTETVQECTSQVFEGLISLADGRSSWVARWQRLDGYVDGTYAVKVTGSVSFPYYACLV